MKRRAVLHHIKFLTAYCCGYGVAATTYTGDWWWMLMWLSLLIGSVLEVAAERVRFLRDE